CTGSCEQAWPPVASPVRLPAGVKLAGAIGYIVRANGERQVTIDGYPIYRYEGDMTPGQTNGNGVNGEWHVVKVKVKVKVKKTSSSGSSGSGGGTGGGW
ncbi:MAG TPA: hypothetical protein VGG16_18955, partial [Streptosporangiaceae bacterium]